MNGPDDRNDLFDPERTAIHIREALKSHDDEERRVAMSMHEYHIAYLWATVHGDPSRPSPTPDGTVVYYSPMARAHALYYTQIVGMSLGCEEPDGRERKCARDSWGETDWAALWRRCVADGNLAATPPG
jgi:hypothetical protein